jgi:hypothetical protein
MWCWPGMQVGPQDACSSSLKWLYPILRLQFSLLHTCTSCSCSADAPDLHRALTSIPRLCCTCACFTRLQDVQPAQEPDWRTNPFELNAVNEYLYGRGTSDNKVRTDQ